MSNAQLFRSTKPLTLYPLPLQKGFTLIELLVTIAIVLTLSVVSVSFLSRFLTQNEVANTTDRLIGSLRKAQTYSMASKQNGAWGVHFATPTITLFQGSTYAGRNSAFDESFTVNSNITISGWSDVIFAKVTGLPSTTPTVTISSNTISRTVTVNAQGVVSK